MATSLQGSETHERATNLNIKLRILTSAAPLEIEPALIPTFNWFVNNKLGRYDEDVFFLLFVSYLMIGLSGFAAGS